MIFANIMQTISDNGQKTSNYENLASKILIYQISEEKKIQKIFLGGGLFLHPQKLTFLKKSPLKDRAKIFLAGVLGSSHCPLLNEKKKHRGVPTKKGGVGGVLNF